MKEYAKSFYNSRAWEQCRKSYLLMRGGLCERCEAVGSITPATIVHHKIYINADNITNPAITLNYNNLEALCQECHNKEHNTKHARRYFVGEFGELIIDD